MNHSIACQLYFYPKSRLRKNQAPVVNNIRLIALIRARQRLIRRFVGSNESGYPGGHFFVATTHRNIKTRCLKVKTNGENVPKV
jgi:hypothetical protein